MDTVPVYLKPSHGSLHGAYRNKILKPVVGSKIAAHRIPLRNVSQNSTLLQSPGPLESMLKTTTETGDIRVFSIQSQAGSPRYHHLSRSRSETETSDVAFAPARCYQMSEPRYYRDEQKRALRSYRDTTSEIISLYGYDQQPFHLRPGSPMVDDNSPRSYSITTCSSRHLPSQKSSGTLQSQSSGSGSGLHRSRSPFPYPTRLKRPGVTSASPALAQNGCVDYSKMIEFDQVSQVGNQRFLLTWELTHCRGLFMARTNIHTQRRHRANRLLCRCGRISAGQQRLFPHGHLLYRIIHLWDQTGQGLQVHTP